MCTSTWISIWPHLIAFFPTDDGQVAWALVRYELEHARKPLDIVAVFPIYAILADIHEISASCEIYGNENLPCTARLRITWSSNHHKNLARVPNQNPPVHPSPLRTHAISCSHWLTRVWQYRELDACCRKVLWRVPYFVKHNIGCRKMELTVSRAKSEQTVEVCTEVFHRLVYGSEYVCGSIGQEWCCW